MTEHNGAQALVDASRAAGVELCLANAGTTEMAIVAALANTPTLRAVPVLFEGVASGAADGYARLRGRPAAVLLHLGPGLSNASANLHNARRAQSPVVCWVGDHARWLRPYDPPLASDIAALAGTTATWVGSVASAREMATAARAAVAAARGVPQGVATLILPDDIQREAAEFPVTAMSPVNPPAGDLRNVEPIAAAVRKAEAPALLVGGRGVEARALAAAARIAATGMTVYTEQFPRCLHSAPELPFVERLAYFPAAARAQLTAHDLIVLAGAERPVSFFGYAGEAPALTHEAQRLESLVADGVDPAAALEALADALQAPRRGTGRGSPHAPAMPTGALTPPALAALIAADLPEDAIVVDEGITLSPTLYAGLAAAREHDYLSCKGGSIGWGLPAATGAALAAPTRRVIAVVGDGSAAYTLQALWTQARENLDVTTVVVANQQYAILQLELLRSGAPVHGAAQTLTTLSPPALDFVSLAYGFGVPAQRVTTSEECAAALRASMASPGPALIEARLATLG